MNLLNRRGLSIMLAITLLAISILPSIAQDEEPTGSIAFVDADGNPVDVGYNLQQGNNAKGGCCRAIVEVDPGDWTVAVQDGLVEQENVTVEVGQTVTVTVQMTGVRVVDSNGLPYETTIDVGEGERNSSFLILAPGDYTVSVPEAGVEGEAVTLALGESYTATVEIAQGTVAFVDTAGEPVTVEYELEGEEDYEDEGSQVIVVPGEYDLSIAFTQYSDTPMSISVAAGETQIITIEEFLISTVHFVDAAGEPLNLGYTLSWATGGRFANGESLTVEPGSYTITISGTDVADLALELVAGETTELVLDAQPVLVKFVDADNNPTSPFGLLDTGSEQRCICAEEIEVQAGTYSLFGDDTILEPGSTSTITVEDPDNNDVLITAVDALIPLLETRVLSDDMMDDDMGDDTDDEAMGGSGEWLFELVEVTTGDCPAFGITEPDMALAFFEPLTLVEDGDSLVSDEGVSLTLDGDQYVMIENDGELESEIIVGPAGASVMTGTLSWKFNHTEENPCIVEGTVTATAQGGMAGGGDVADDTETTEPAENDGDGTEAIEASSEGSDDMGGSCTVAADQAGVVGVHVGPGTNRTRIAFLEAGTDFAVIGQAQDGDGATWFALNPEEAAPGKLIEQAWVPRADIRESGDCDSVEAMEGSAVVPASGSGAASTENIPSGLAGSYLLQMVSASEADCPGLGITDAATAMSLFEPTVLTPSADGSTLTSADGLVMVWDGSQYGLTFSEGALVMVVTLVPTSDTTMAGGINWTINAEDSNCSIVGSVSATAQ